MNEKRNTATVMNYAGYRWKLADRLSLIGVVVVHAALLVYAVHGMRDKIPVITQPSVVGVLVPPSPALQNDSHSTSAPSLEHQAVPKSNKAVAPAPVAKQSSLPPAVIDRQAVVAASPAGKSPIGASGKSASSGTASGNTGGSGHLSLPYTDAAHLNNPKPAYPPVSRRMREEGRVLLAVYILSDGRVGEVKLKQSCGFSRLDQSAIEAVRRWRYVPARRGNQPIPYWYVQPITFSLDS